MGPGFRSVREYHKRQERALHSRVGLSWASICKCEHLYIYTNIFMDLGHLDHHGLFPVVYLYKFVFWLNHKNGQWFYPLERTWRFLRMFSFYETWSKYSSEIQQGEQILRHVVVHMSAVAHWRTSKAYPEIYHQIRWYSAVPCAFPPPRDSLWCTQTEILDVRPASKWTSTGLFLGTMELLH